MAGTTSDIMQDAGLGASIGSVVPGVGTLIGGLGGAAIGAISGLFGRKKANNILRNNPYPNQPLPTELTANQQIAQNAALEGMPSEQYQAAQRDIQRNQASATAAAATQPGGAVRQIGAIQQASNDATGNLNAQSAQMRRQNIDRLIGVNSQIASYRDKLFDWNQRQKYIQQYNYGMGLLGQSNQNLLSGADKLLGTVAGATASGLFGGGGRSPGQSPALSSQGGVDGTAAPTRADTSGGMNDPSLLFGGRGINPIAPNLIGQ